MGRNIKLNLNLIFNNLSLYFLFRSFVANIPSLLPLCWDHIHIAQILCCNALGVTLVVVVGLHCCVTFQGIKLALSPCMEGMQPKLHL